MPRSEIFENYLRIAEEAGFFKDAEEKESKELKKYKEDVYPRVGSDDISTIEALYGIKPDDAVIKYEDNIIEAAHPDPVVIAPSYDKINGLVENSNERQNIIHHLVMKQNDGILNQTRYAEKELLMSLVRLANDLDFRGEEELRKIADECIERIALKKKADFSLDDVEKWLGRQWGDLKEEAKGGGTGAIIGGIAGGLLGAFLGKTPTSFLAGARAGAWAGGSIGMLLAGLMKTSPRVVSVAENAQNCVSQLEDLKKKTGSGPEFEFLDRFQTALTQLSNSATSYNDMLSRMHNSNSTSDAESAHQVATALLQQIDVIKGFASQFNDRVQRQVYNKYTENWASKLTEPLYSFIDNDVEDVTKSLQSLFEAIEDFEKATQLVGQAAQNPVGGAQSAPQQQPSSMGPLDESSIELTPDDKDSVLNYIGQKEQPGESGRFREFLQSVLGQ